MENLSLNLGMQIGPWDLGQLVTALAVLLVAFVASALLTRWLARKMLRLAERTSSAADDAAVKAVVGPVGLVVLLAGLYTAFRILAVGYPGLSETSGTLFKVLVTVIAAWLLFRITDAAALGLRELAARTDSKLDDQLIPMVRKSVKVFIVLIAFLLTAQNLGYSVSALVAGLGIGGLAVALAAKDTIANLFGSITILLDRPFRVGDWITTSDADGTVEEIGFRSTRIRTFAKTLVSIPNQQLANETVENHSLMPKRRVKMTVGVTYDTGPDQMREVIRRIEAYLEGHADIHQEFKLVKFTDFNESSLDIFLYYFTVTTDWSEHLALRQEVNLAVMDILQELGLSIAFPTRTVHFADREAPGELQ